MYICWCVAECIYAGALLEFLMPFAGFVLHHVGCVLQQGMGVQRIFSGHILCCVGCVLQDLCLLILFIMLSVFMRAQHVFVVVCLLHELVDHN
jgi:hypothetical protein